MKLLIIDPQNDFCSKDGSLYVPGADEDMKRLSEFIAKNIAHITKIIVTMDSHPYYHIGHPVYWTNRTNDHPKPFTNITTDDIISGRYSCKYKHFFEERYKVHNRTIWPYHCVIGTWGQLINSDIRSAITSWESIRHNSATYIFKGTDPDREQYSAFKAEASNELNIQALDACLANYNNDNLVVAGEASSHCVKESLKHLFPYIELYGKYKQKVIILNDCMSSVPGYETETDFLSHLPAYAEAKESSEEIR